MKAKLPAYGLASALVLLLVLEMAWVSGLAWQHLNRLRKDYRVVQSEGFHLAEHVEEKMLALNETLRRLDAHPDPALLADFLGQAAEMKLWVRTNRSLATRAQQRALFNPIEAAIDVYASRASRLAEENLRTDSGVKAKPVLEQVEKEASEVFGLARQLRVAEQVALDLFIQESRASLGNLCRYILLWVAVALALDLAVLRCIYLAGFAPLQAKLAHNFSILEEQEKLASLGTLVAGVAHEVRNPLTAIAIRLHSLKRTIPENSSARDDLSVIQGEINRLEQLVGEFSQFALPRSPEVQTFPVATLFEQVTGLMRPRLEAAGIRWNIEAPPGICVQADPQQIKQVLLNLLQNAADSTGRGGSITLRARTCQARWPSGTAAGIVLEVADTGKGIPPEVAKRLFDPFFSTKATGTGLGLPIAARIVEKHGGAIQYETKVGVGTTFSVILPTAKGDNHGT